MKKIFTLALLCACFNGLYAQVNLSKNFLYLYSDSVIYGNQILYEAWVDGSPHFLVDSKRIHPEQVKFFQNEMGFFANTRDLVFTNETSFSERIRAGKINLFEGSIAPQRPYSYHYPYHSASHRPTNSDDFQLNYYNIGLGELKKATYDNLKYDLADNEQSMNYLQQYQKRHSLSRKLFVAGGAAILGGFVSFLANGSRDVGKASGFPEPGWIDRTPSPRLGLSFGLMFAGAGLSGVGAFQTLTKSRYLKQAVDSYNRSR